MDVVPRMRTATPPSAVRITVTPGNRPMRTFSIGSPGVRWMSSDVTVAVCAGLVRLAPLEWVHPERIPTLRPTRSRAREGSEGMGNLRGWRGVRSEEHTSELQSRSDIVCRLLLEKKKPHDR